MGMLSTGTSGKERPFIGLYNEVRVFGRDMSTCFLCVPVRSKLANVPPLDSRSENMRTFFMKRCGSLDRCRRIKINMAKNTRDATTMIMIANARPAVSSLPELLSSIMATVMGTALGVASVCIAGRAVVNSKGRVDSKRVTSKAAVLVATSGVDRNGGGCDGSRSVAGGRGGGGDGGRRIVGGRVDGESVCPKVLWTHKGVKQTVPVHRMAYQSCVFPERHIRAVLEAL